jgi:23S rRNA (uracil1939-C5)-methyltransferase
MSRPGRRDPAVGGRTRKAMIRAEKLVGGGRALAHHGGDTWLVAGALPNEEVEVVVTGQRSGVVEAQAVELRSTPHPSRISDPCPHAVQCGGCDWPHVDPDSGSRLKAHAAAEAAGRAPELAERLAAAQVRISPLGYRLRARLHWDPVHQVLGFYTPRTWTVVEIPCCRILSPRLMATLGDLSGALAETCPEQVDLEWLEDLDGGTAVAALRPGRTGPHVISSTWVPTEDRTRGAVDGFHLLSGSGQSTVVWGNESVTMRLRAHLEVPIGAFFQVNRHLLRWLFRRLEELVGRAPVPTWDLFAGVGLLAATANCAAPRPLHLVEPHKDAARAAQRNLPAARVSIGRTAEAFLGRARNLPTDALVLTDPPRTGMSPQLRSQLVGWHPDRILSLACDPGTWARDTAFLIDHGYRLEHIELVDLFPLTHHVEILALLHTE